MSNANNSKFDPFCSKKHQCKDCDNRCVNQIAFLKDLPMEFQNALMLKAEYKKFKKDAYIFHEGDSVDAVTIVRKGKIKLTITDSDGREKIIGIFSSNDTIWEGIFLDNSVYPYNAVCLTDTHIWKIYRKDVELAVEDAALAKNVISMLSRKLHDANERNLIMSISDPEAKVAKFLLYRDRQDHNGVINLRLDDIAASVALRPETVSRKLSKFIELGYIERVSKSGIRILDYHKLTEFVNNK